MPAAAVIPAPIAYIKVVAVKKLVVGFVSHAVGSPARRCLTGMYRGTSLPVGRAEGARPPRACPCVPRRTPLKSYRGALYRVPRWAGTFTLNKLECLKQASPPEYCVHGIME